MRGQIYAEMHEDLTKSKVRFSGRWAVALNQYQTYSTLGIFNIFPASRRLELALWVFSAEKHTWGKTRANASSSLRTSSSVLAGVVCDRRRIGSYNHNCSDKFE